MSKVDLTHVTDVELVQEFHARAEKAEAGCRLVWHNVVRHACSDTSGKPHAHVCPCGSIGVKED